MNTVRVCDSTVRKLSNGKDISLSFKEKLEVAKLLDKLCVDVIELDEIRNGKADTLLVKSVVTAASNSTVAVPIAEGRARRRGNCLFFSVMRDPFEWGIGNRQ